MATYSYPENVTKALKENGLNKDSLWDCHGTWVLKHSACETIAANRGITFDEPLIIESDADKSIAIVMVKGYLGDKFEWTFGEATPKNSKNSYPYAMAEKRAKDRIILKLIGLHGDVYSEDEADVFKDEIAAQEKLDKRVEQERVDTSVYGKVGKKKATEEIKKLTPLFAKFQSDDKKMSDEALKDAKGINEWAKKHNLSIVQEKYYKLFERQKSA
jgi:hypothetical protein